MKTPAPNMTNDNKTVINLDDARVLAARLNMRVEHQPSALSRHWFTLMNDQALPGAKEYALTVCSLAVPIDLGWPKLAATRCV